MQAEPPGGSGEGGSLPVAASSLDGKWIRRAAGQPSATTSLTRAPESDLAPPNPLTPTTASPSNMGDEPRKRSRFDQAEPDPPRRSKFDRRSRSPAQRDSEGAARSRSPVAKSVESAGPKRDAAAAAAEAAARINAQLSQKKAPQHVDVPPIRAVWP